MTVQEIPSNEQLMNLPEASSVGPTLRFVLNGLVWPNEATLHAQASEGEFHQRMLLDDTLTWIEAVLKPEWMAPDLRERLQAARAIVDDRDGFLARYAVDGNKIQIAVTESYLYVVIVPVGAFEATGVMREFLRVDQPGDETQWTDGPWKVIGVEGFTFGYRPQSYLAAWRDSLNYLSQDRAVKFSIRKVETWPPGLLEVPKSSSAPSEESERDWFDQLL
jgi:hypothetical protein